MKKIFRIFLNDLRSVAKNLIVFIVIIGICILPALYAWFNIAANWDPYSSTDGLTFAVCSMDKGYKFKSISINAGDQIVDNLKKNDKMGWTFVTEKEAINGVKDGTYYAAVIVPKDFSECLLSLTTGKFEQAKLQYYVNEKKNAIAPKITDKGIQTIEETVNSTYVSTITKMIATTLNLSTESLDKTKDKATDTLIGSLDKAKEELGNVKKRLDTYVTTLDTLGENIDEKKEQVVPDIQKRITDTQNSVANAKNSIAAGQSAALQVTDSIETSIISAQNISNDIVSRVDSAFDKAGSDSKAAAAKFRDITNVNDRVITVYNRIISVFTTIQDTLDIDCSDVIGRLNSAVERQNSIKEYVNRIADTLEKGEKVSEDVKSKLDELVQNSSGDSSSVSTAFANIKGRINQAVARSYQSLDKVTVMLTNLNEKVPELNDSFDKANESVDKVKDKIKTLKKSISNAEKKLERYSTLIDLAMNNTSIESLIEPVTKNPEALGEFVASPVTIKEHHEYPLDNYGSGMTPFYSTLALWVGGIVLVAVMKTDMTKHELRKLDNPNNTQQYFGRYFIYLLIGQIQAWIIALGDLFFLKVQCDDPGLFILGALVSSFVYTLIIYSLTITFSVIGKALAVIILVIQIAGAGGTFPIEVLPAPFQSVAPYLPFKYSVNLLREAVAGVNAAAYRYNLLMLLAFVPFALVLGIILRKPCIKVISFFNNRVEQSDIIV